MPVNDEEVLQALDRLMNGRGNGARTAKLLDVDYSHLRQFKSGYRRINQKVAEKLGFELRWIRKDMARLMPREPR